jgi:hypothetical protein
METEDGKKPERSAPPCGIWIGLVHGRALASFLPGTPPPSLPRPAPPVTYALRRVSSFSRIFSGPAGRNVTYADEQGEAAQEAKRLPSLLPPLSLSLSLSLPLVHPLCLRLSLSVSFAFAPRTVLSVLATIFQKKSKRRLGNLGVPPSPLDRQLYSAQTCVRKRGRTSVRAIRTRGACSPRVRAETESRVWTPRRRALRGRIYRVSPTRAGSEDGFIRFPAARGVGAQLFPTNSARLLRMRGGNNDTPRIAVSEPKRPRNRRGPRNRRSSSLIAIAIKRAACVESPAGSLIPITMLPLRNRARRLGGIDSPENGD